METSTIYIAEINTTRKYYLRSVSSIQNKTSKTITSYPTTEGTPMSDHSYRDPYDITVSLMASELSNHKNFYYIDAGNEVTITAKELKDLLFKWRDEDTRLILQTRQTQYNNMIITDISWADNNNNLGAFNPSITFSECRIASIYTKKLGPFEDETDSPRYNDEQNLGNSNGVNVGADLLDIGKSTLGAAAAGAAIGSVIPVIGTGTGALIGGIYGAVKSFGRKLGWWG